MLTFSCDHCGTSKEYTPSTVNQIGGETQNLRGFIVCKQCAEDFKGISTQVKEYADKKREELENAFFNIKPEELKEIVEKAGEELDQVLKDLSSK